MQGKRFRFGATAIPDAVRVLSGDRPAEPHPAQLLAKYHLELLAGGDVPEEFARAIAVPGQPLELRSDAQQTRQHRPVPDVRGQGQAARRATRLTRRPKDPDPQHQHQRLTYDFEQAKKPGRTGWATQTLTNSLPERPAARVST